MLPREGIGVEDLLEGMLEAPKRFRNPARTSEMDLSVFTISISA